MNFLEKWEFTFVIYNGVLLVIYANTLRTISMTAPRDRLVFHSIANNYDLERRMQKSVVYECIF